MNFRKMALKAVSVFLAVAFFWTNCVWASGLSADKLAAQTQMGLFAGMPLDAVGKLFAGAEVMHELGIRTEADVVQNLDRLMERGVVCFARSDEAGNSAQYVFIHNGIFLRITDEGIEVKDDFYTKLLKEEGVRKTEEGKVYELCFVTDENVELINAILSSINSGWSISPYQIRKTQGEQIDRSGVKLHLFPEYIHKAIETSGVIYYDSKTGKIVEPSEDELKIIAEILRQKLQENENKRAQKECRVPKTIEVEKEKVREVLLMHEKLHKIIKDKGIDINSLLIKLRQYYGNDELKLNTLLCSFARDYNYLPQKNLINNEYILLSEQEQLMLVEEVLVHEYIERHFFKQPIRVRIYNQSRGTDLGRDVEFIFFRGLKPKEVVYLFAGLLSIEDEKMRDYFLLLYETYLDYLEGEVPHLEIGRSFRPSAVLSDTERMDKLGAIEYIKLLGNRGKYTDAAKNVRLILNPLDGGIGDIVVRGDYLQVLRGEGLPVGVNVYGAKGADMHISLTSDDKISIMEAKLFRAIQDAKKEKYGFVEYHMLGSSESAKSFDKVLDFPCRMSDANGRTYRHYINDHPNIMGLVEVQLGIKVPAVDAGTGCLTTENTGHGNHGIRGTYFFQEAPDHKIEDGGMHIRVIYNGDGINNGVDPEIVGYMASERVPVIMVTTTKTDIDKKGGQIGLQIIEEGTSRYNVQIMELAQAKAIGEGQQRLFYDMGLKSGSYIKDNQPGKQYFNTNTVLMNISVLRPLLKELIDIIGIDEFRKAMAPVLVMNKKKSGNKKYYQLEGALGSVVLSLAGYLDGTQDARIKGLLKKHGIEKFLRIVNIDGDDRNRFFTPFKETSDFWFLFSSGRFDFDEDKMELIDRYLGRPMPRFELENTYDDDVDKKLQFYSDVSKLEESFTGIDITGLNTLEIPGRPVLLKGSILKGRVAIFNIAKRIDGQDKVKTANTVVNIEDIKKRLIGKCGIREENGRLVLKNVCVLVGDTDVFVSEITEDDGDLSADYFARQIYRLIDNGEEVPDRHILVTITEKLHQKFDLKPMEEELPELRTDAEVRSYVKPVTVFPKPKYGKGGRPRYFDGISAICRLPRGSELSRKTGELMKCVFESQMNIKKDRLIANVAQGKEQITVFNGIAAHNWKKRYENELNKETKDEIEARKNELTNGTKMDEETALKQAIYEVVSKRIAEALKEFSVWKRPVFKPHRVVLFPPDQSRGKTHLAVTMVPATAEDMAILTKMRDIIREKTGIEDYVDFKRHITIGYFVDTLENLEEYEEFKELVKELNDKVKAISEDKNYRFELPDIELCFYTDMENFTPLRVFSWVDRNHNQTAGTIFGKEIAEQIRRVQTKRRPKAGPVGKAKEGEYTELWYAEVVSGKVLGGAEAGIGKQHAKFDNINQDKLQTVLDKIGSEQGIGITAVIDAVRVVDNIEGYNISEFKGSKEISPYAMMVKEDGKNVLLLDVDAFTNEELLYIVLEHELKESITTIIPYEDEAVRELTTNFMSLKLVLEKGIKIDKAQLKQLGADLQFFEALEVLQAMKDAGEEVTDEKIIAVAIEHMRSMPYYAELFKEFSFAGKWIEKIKDVQDRYRAALQVFNDIAEAKEMAGKVKDIEKIAITVIKTFTGLRIDGLDRIKPELAGMIGALAKQVSSTDKIAGILKKAGGRKYILVDKGRLKQLKDAVGEAEYKKIEENLLTNNYEICGEVPDGVDLRNVIRIVDPGDLEDIERLSGMLYLPMLYTRSSLYMAACVLHAEGDLDKLPLIKGMLKDFYQGLTVDDLKMLIKQPWQILPKIQSVIRNLDDLRKAIVQMEVSA